jgi:hypothetical protein
MATMQKLAQVLIVLVAGAGAFVAAANWSRQRSPGDAGDSGEVVAVAARPSAAASAVATPAPSASTSASTSTSAAAPTAQPASGPAGAAPAVAAAASAVAGAASAAGRRVPSTSSVLAFSPLNWTPPPPPPPAPVAPVAPPPPPAPVAPPLPFSFVGMVERGADRPQAYLAKGDVLLVVAVGDVIDNNNYRVDALSPTGVVLTYLPLRKQQTVNIP